MTPLKGPDGFNEFYLEMYGDRWATIKEALLAPKKHVAVLNPFSKYKFPDTSRTPPDHQLSNDFYCLTPNKFKKLHLGVIDVPAGCGRNPGGYVFQFW